MAPSPKQHLRAHRRTTRRTLIAGRDLAADAAALAAHLRPLLADLGVGPGDDVAAYESLPHEPPMTAVCGLLTDRGARVLAPITLASYDLDWFDVADPMRAPLGVEALSACRLVLVPGLACDDAGNRLGQAGGCYDRALPRTRPGARTIVVLHPGEILAEPLPIDPWDRAVDGALTADGLVWFRPVTGRA